MNHGPSRAFQPGRHSLCMAALCVASIAVGAPPEAPSQIPPATAPSETEAAVDAALEEITVSGSRVPSVAPSLDRVEVYDDAFIERSDTFAADALLQKLPPNLPGTSQTVLIDGRRSSMDPASIPVEMIDRIEVNSDGNMPDGEHVAGSVVNIILKKNYSGKNLNLRDGSPLAGGGSRQEFMFNAASIDNGFGSMVAVSHRVTGGLTANERDFSSNQDHLPKGGRDFRLPWGYPAVVQAVSGNLNGLVTAGGQPVATALAPAALPNGLLTPADFIPGPAGVTDATGLRRYNTAADLYLQAPSTIDALNLSFSHPLAQSMHLELRYGISHSESEKLLPPPTTPASTASVVPGAYNPFGQPVEVGLVNLGFGAIHQDSSSTAQNAELSLGGMTATHWEWNARGMLEQTGSEQHFPQLDPTLFAAALASANLSQRFDPFASDGPGTPNAGLYPALTDSEESHTNSQQASLGLDAHGELGQDWARPIQLAVSAEYRTAKSSQDSSVAGSGASSVRTRAISANEDLNWPIFRLHDSAPPATLDLHANWTQVTQRSDASLTGGAPFSPVAASTLSASLRVPWITPTASRPGAYRLETELGVGESASTGRPKGRTQQAVLSWMPLPILTLRVSDAAQQIAPPTTAVPVSVAYDQVLLDPLRNIPIATGVEVVSGVPSNLVASVNSQRSVSIDLAPTPGKGFRADLNYTEQDLRDPVRHLSAQDVIDNEAALPSDVTRSAPEPKDLALGQPGPIVAVNVTPFNAGAARIRTLDYSLSYDASMAALDTLVVGARARQVLESDNDLVPGMALVSTSNDTSPPEWSYNAEVNWKRGAWDFDTEYSRTGNGRYGQLPYAAYTSVNVRVSYRLAPLWKGPANGPQIGLGIANLLDASPPYVDTLTGFRGGSPLGRTAELTFRIPLS